MAVSEKCGRGRTVWAGKYSVPRRWGGAGGDHAFERGGPCQVIGEPAGDEDALSICGL